MANIMLLIGSVTTKMYKPFQLDLLREGCRPQVKRINFDDLGFDWVEGMPDIETLSLASGISPFEFENGIENAEAIAKEFVMSETGLEPGDLLMVVVKDPGMDDYQAGMLGYYLREIFGAQTRHVLV